MEERSNLPFEASAFPLPGEPVFGTGKRELRFCGFMILAGILLADFVIYGGFYLGFAVAAALGIVGTAVYLLRSGCRLNGYCGGLLGLSLVICASFVRSNDGFVKLVMICFLLVSANLGLCLLAGQNRRDPAGVASLLDVPRTVFMLGLGKMGAAFRGLNVARKQIGTAGKNRSAVLVGLLIAVPVLAILIPLLVSADAAFEGLLGLLPEVDLSEPIAAVILGLCAACLLYTRGVALLRGEKEPAVKKERKGMNPLTVNTVMIMVCVLYAVYLVSQLAYVSGGLAGILPEAFTMAEYARRGFFEMAWLCALNLALMTAAVALTAAENGRSPVLTRSLCLAVGLVTLFFVATAAAKMIMYIDAYGLTRLRVLTSVIMVFLALTTIFVSLWLFLPKLPYMKAILITGLLIGAVTAWVDVDTVVAAYNVRAYQTGRLETVDVWYLNNLSDGAVPYLAELTKADDAFIAKEATQLLAQRERPEQDIRSWNIAGAVADAIEE